MMNIGASKARKPINHRKVAVIPRCGGGREGGGYDDEGKKGGRREGNKWPSSSLTPPPIEVLRRAISDNFSKLVFRRFTAVARSLTRPLALVWYRVPYEKRSPILSVLPFILM